MTEFNKKLAEIRHDFHMHPETAFEEKRTADIVAQILADLGIEVHTGIGGTGVVGVLRAGSGRKVVGLRADMDALNLQEQGTHPYASVYPGKFHGCGHDGHTATLLGAAMLLAQNRNFDGTVVFVFQPAEEPGKGAHAMMRDGLLARFPMDEIYGLHNQPSFPFGTIHTRPGGLCASEDNFVVEIHGLGGHSSAPHFVKDPMIAAAQIILAFQTVVARNVDPADTAVISCTEIHSDGARNAIPSNVTIKGDTRSTTPEVQAVLENRMRTLCEEICAANGMTCTFTYTHEFAPAYNQAACVDLAVRAATNLFGAEKAFGNTKPLMASEDFGAFTEKIPGCFVILGSGRADGEDYPLHNARADYNDEALEVGARLFEEIVRLALPK